MRLTIFPVIAVATALAACAETAQFKPAPTAHAIAGLEAGAVSKVSNVRVVARPDVWPGNAPIEEEVVPIRVTIENGSDEPLRVQYREFALVEPNGEIHAALPPLAIDATVSERVPVANPRFIATGFAVAPYYAPFYPTLPLADPIGFDPLYNTYYYDYWRRYELPTPQMIAYALPEGKLAPGGRISGFVYFEDVDADEVPRVTFRMDLINAENGRSLGTVQIPFLVS